MAPSNIKAKVDIIHDHFSLELTRNVPRRRDRSGDPDLLTSLLNQLPHPGRDTLHRRPTSRFFFLSLSASPAQHLCARCDTAGPQQRDLNHALPVLHSRPEVTTPLLGCHTWYPSPCNPHRPHRTCLEPPRRSSRLRGESSHGA